MEILQEITIDADRQTVWRYFDDPESMRRWQPNLTSEVHKQGTPGKPGAISEVIYDHDGRDLRAIATLISKEEPEFMSATYDSDWSQTTITNRFDVLANGKTRWVYQTNIRFKGWSRIAAIFLRKTMQTRAYMEMQRLKQHIETDQADNGQ